MLPSGIERHRFDVTEYHRMLEVGLLAEDDWVELIGGEIVDTAPISWRHMGCVNRLTSLLVPIVSELGYVVSVQDPVRLGVRDEPEPDFALLADEPRDDLPTPEDAPLVIEVSDSSLQYDKEIKLPLYARSGVLEVWVVDLQAHRIEVYTEPSPEGYRAMKVFAAGKQIYSQAIEEVSLSVNEVLG